MEFKKYKNKNFEEFLDETIIYISVLTFDKSPTVFGKSIQPFSNY
jgi:hypothetical protein